MIKLYVDDLAAEATQQSLPVDNGDFPKTAGGNVHRSAETLAMAKRIRFASSIGEAIELRNKIVMLNLALVPFTLRSMNLPTRRNDDAHSEGICGLIEAAGRFDPDRGNGFASFAIPHIRGRIVSWLCRCNSLTGSPSVGRRTYRLRCAARELPGGLNCSSVILAKWTGMRVRTVECLVRFVRRPVDLDADMARAIPVDGPDPREAGALDDYLAELRASLQLLPARQQKIIREIYGLEGGEHRLQRAIALELGLTRQRVGQLLGEALARLRRHVER